MSDDFFYLDEGHVRITAASVGINSKRWTCIDDSVSQEDTYKSIMKDNRFDVLPIVSQNKTVIEFFKTEEPNKYGAISRECISYKDVLPCETLIREVIKGFAIENRTFYFLSYQNRITGLITIGNLNCRQVQVYIFELICNLERNLSEFLDFYKGENSEDIEKYVQKKAETNQKMRETWEKYQSDIKKGLENKLMEYLYTIDFFKILKHFKLYEKIHYSKKEWEDLEGINELRHLITHPTRSLLNPDNDINTLWKRIQKIEDLTFRLSQWKREQK